MESIFSEERDPTRTYELLFAHIFHFYRDIANFEIVYRCRFSAQSVSYPEPLGELRNACQFGGNAPIVDLYLEFPKLSSAPQEEP